MLGWLSRAFPSDAEGGVTAASGDAAKDDSGDRIVLNEPPLKLSTSPDLQAALNNAEDDATKREIDRGYKGSLANAVDWWSMENKRRREQPSVNPKPAHPHWQEVKPNLLAPRSPDGPAVSAADSSEQEEFGVKVENMGLKAGATCGTNQPLRCGEGLACNTCWPRFWKNCCKHVAVPAAKKTPVTSPIYNPDTYDPGIDASGLLGPSALNPDFGFEPDLADQKGSSLHQRRARATPNTQPAAGSSPAATPKHLMAPSSNATTLSQPPAPSDQANKMTTATDTSNANDSYWEDLYFLKRAIGGRPRKHTSGRKRGRRRTKRVRFRKRTKRVRFRKRTVRSKPMHKRKTNGRRRATRTK